MKKLYAKTTFAQKNRRHNSLKSERDVLSKCYEPIYAYQGAENSMTSSPNPLTTSLKRSSLDQMLMKSTQYSSDYKDSGDPPEYCDTPTAAAAADNRRSSSSSSSFVNKTSFYYAISELESLNLPMVDHRHPQFHQMWHMEHQPLQQQLHYEHNQLVLQLPTTSSSPNIHTHDSTASLTSSHYDTPQQQQQFVTYPKVMNAAPSHAIDSGGNFINEHHFRPKSSLQVLPRVCAKTLTATRSLSNISPATVGTTDGVRAATVYVTRAPSSRFSAAYCDETTTTTPVATPLMTLKANTSSDCSIYQTLHKNYVQTSSTNSARLNEQSIIGARASVMVYDDNQKKWVPSGSSSGLSKVQIYHHQQNNTFRVVGRKLQDHEVVINCSILKGLKYNQATATFHQWRDNKYVYGLNFSSQHDAESFARAMMHALDVLSGRVVNNVAQPINGNGYDEDMGYRTMTSEEAAILRQQQQLTGQVTPSAQTPTSQVNQNNIPQSPPTPQGHHRASRNSLSVPAAVQATQMQQHSHIHLQQQQQQQQQHHSQQQQQVIQPTIYGPNMSGPNQNGMPPSTHHNHQQQQQQQLQMQPPTQPLPPIPGQTQYHTPQQLPAISQQLQQPQQQQAPSLQQQQQQQPQPSTQPQTQLQVLQPHSIYASQQLPNNSGYQQQQQQQQSPIPVPAQPPSQQQQQLQNQYQQAHYVVTNSNNNLNIQQYTQQQQQQAQLQAMGPNNIQSQQQQQQQQPPLPPPHQNLNGGINVGGAGSAPIYMSAPIPMLAAPGPGGIPNSTSSGSVVYASGGSGGVGGPSSHAPPPPPHPPAPPIMPNAPPMPPNSYNQMNGGSGVGGGGAQMQVVQDSHYVVSTQQPPPLPSTNTVNMPPAPPPPPPPPMAGMAAKKEDTQNELMSSLAAQLQQAKLKKKTAAAAAAAAAESSNSSTPSSAGGSGNYGTIGRSTTGMASMMDEMAKTLARRRAQAEKKEPEPEAELKQRPWEKSNTLPHKLGNGGNSSSSSSTNASISSTNNPNSAANATNGNGESPRPIRKRFGSASEETILKQVNGEGLSLALTGSDLEQLKAEIVKEMKMEIQKVKQEIIDAIKTEFNRR